MVANPSEILPRQQLLSVPFAVQAQVASSLVTNLENALCPSGSIIAFGGTNIPAGWLLCDGTALSSSQYPGLYAAIGMNWGSGDISTGGTNNFNLPDLRGLFLRGVNGTRTTFTQVSTNFVDTDVLSRTNGPAGGNIGNAVGSLETDEMTAHTHNIDDHFPECNWSNGRGRFFTDGQSVANLQHPTTTQSVIAGNTETRPKNAYVNYIIKY
jgi:microcystin-dependent protein